MRYIDWLCTKHCSVSGIGTVFMIWLPLLFISVILPDPSFVRTPNTFHSHITISSRHGLHDSCLVCLTDPELLSIHGPNQATDQLRTGPSMWDT